MTIVRVKVDRKRPEQLPEGRVNPERLDATTEQDRAVQQQTDDAEAMQDVADMPDRCAGALDSLRPSSPAESKCPWTRSATESKANGALQARPSRY